MKLLHLTPYGFPCSLSECPPGPFLFAACGQQFVGFKSEYTDGDGRPTAYNEAGEYYCGDTDGEVQPLIYEWIEE